MRHLNHIAAEHLTVGQEALVVAGLVGGCGEVRTNRLRARLAWSPCYRPTFGSKVRPMLGSQAASMAMALKRQPAAGGQRSPRDCAVALPLTGSLSAGSASSCPAGSR